MARPQDAKNRTHRIRSILTAAAELFAQKGLQDTTMQDICQAAGISPGGLYRYFSGKEAIIQALIEQERESTEDVIKLIDAGSSLLETLETMLDDLVQYLTHPVVSRLTLEFVTHALKTSTDGLKSLNKTEQDLAHAMMRAAKRDQRNGKLPADLCTDSTVYALLALFDGLSTQSAFGNISPPSDLTTVVRRMMRTSLAPPSQGAPDARP